MRVLIATLPLPLAGGMNRKVHVTVNDYPRFACTWQKGIAG
jgi:hypothetical protein